MVFHTTSSFHSFASSHTASSSFPRTFSSVFCLSDTYGVYIFILSLTPLLIIDLEWHLSFPFPSHFFILLEINYTSSDYYFCGCETLRHKTWVVGLCKKPKDLSASEREECEHGEGRDVYGTLSQTDTYSTDIWARKISHEVCGGWYVQKTKDLSASESEECHQWWFGPGSWWYGSG